MIKNFINRYIIPTCGNDIAKLFLQKIIVIYMNQGQQDPNLMFHALVTMLMTLTVDVKRSQDEYYEILRDLVCIMELADSHDPILETEITELMLSAVMK